MPRIPLLLISCFFTIGGVCHFVYIGAFTSIVPNYLPWHRELVIISGVFELLGAAGILIPQTRLFAAYGLMALIVAVYPANINMAIHASAYPEAAPWLLYARLPLQFVFLWFVWWAVKPERKSR